MRQSRRLGRLMRTLGFIILLSVLPGGGCLANGSTDRRASAPAAPEGGRATTLPARALTPLERIAPEFSWPSATTKPTQIDPEATALYLQARARFQQQDAAGAVELLQKALTRQGDNFEAHKLLGRIYAAMQQPQRASKHLQEALKHRPDDVTCLYLLGNLQLQAGDLQGAFANLRLAVLTSQRKDPRLADALLARLLLGKLLASEGYVAAAAEQYQKLLDYLQELQDVGLLQDVQLRRVSQAYRTAIHTALAGFYQKLGRYEQALEVYDRLLRLTDDKRTALAGQIHVLLAAGRVQQAYDKAVELIQADPADVQIQQLFQQVTARSGKGDWLERLADLSLAQLDNRRLGLQVARLLADAGRLRQADQLLRMLIKHDADNLAASWLLVELYVGQDRLDEAVALALKAVRGNPDASAAARLQMHRALGAASAQALLAAIERIQTDRDFAWHYLKGVSAWLAGRFELARENLRKAVQLKGDFSVGYAALGRLFLHLRQWQEAIQVVQQAQQAGVSTLAMDGIRGQALAQLGQEDQAVKILLDVLNRDAANTEVRLALADVYLQKADGSAALQLLRQSLQISPVRGEALEQLIRLLVNSDAFSIAEQVLELYSQRIGEDIRYELLKALVDYRKTGNADRYRQQLEDLASRADHPPQVDVDRVVFHYERKAYREVVQLAGEILKARGPFGLPHRLYQRLRQAEAISHWRLLQYEQSEQIWQTLINTWPKRIAYRQALAQMYLDAQWLEKAQALLEQLLSEQLSEDQTDVTRRRLVRAMLFAGKWQDAAEKVQTWLADARADAKPALQSMLVDCYLWAREYDRAVDQIKQYLQDKDARQQWGARLIDTMVQAGRYREALEVVDKWIEQAQEPKTRVKWIGQKVTVLLAAEQYQQAVELAQANLAAVDEKDKGRWTSVDLLIECHRKAGDYDRALELGRSFLEQNDQPLLVRQTFQEKIVHILLQAGRFQQALQQIEQYRKETSSEKIKEAWDQLLVACYFNADQLDSSRRVLRTVLERDPLSAWANNSLGYSLISAGRLDQAEPHIRLALTDDPGNLSYLDSLGWVYYHRGDFERALHFLLMAYRGSPDPDPVVLDHLGDTYWQLGQREAARSYWQRSVRRASKLQPLLLEPDMPDRTVRKLKAMSTQRPVPVPPPLGKPTKVQ